MNNEDELDWLVMAQVEVIPVVQFLRCISEFPLTEGQISVLNLVYCLCPQNSPTTWHNQEVSVLLVDHLHDEFCTFTPLVH